MEERFKIYKTLNSYDIYSVWGEFKGSFKTEKEAEEFKKVLERNYVITQFKLGRVVNEGRGL